MTADEGVNSDRTRTEEALKAALRHEEVPPGFAERVLARVAEQNSVSQALRDPWWRVFSRPIVRWAAVTATAASLLIGGIHYRNVQRERVEGEAAKQRLMLALRIAGSKLQLARARVNEINATQDRNPKKNEGIKD